MSHADFLKDFKQEITSEAGTDYFKITKNQSVT